MKLLVFEYSSVCMDNSLISEGLCMLYGLLDDLEKINSFDTYFLINEKMDLIDFKNCKPIRLKRSLKSWLSDYACDYDYCLFIAPEDNLIQYGLTKLLEDNDVIVLGSSSEASYVCSSKCLTYKRVPGNILKIRTLKCNISDVDFEEIRNIFHGFDFLVKPDDRTSSDLVYRVLGKEDFEKILGIYESRSVDEILVQEYIPGIPVSVSILCNGEIIQCISVNSQEIKNENNHITYTGCVTPIDVEYENELFDMSREIIKSVPGIKGFCGIDYIIHEDKIYFVEINSRLTTPFIVLQKKCDGNLTEKMLQLMINNRKETVTFKGKGRFYKEE